MQHMRIPKQTLPHITRNRALLVIKAAKGSKIGTKGFGDKPKKDLKPKVDKCPCGSGLSYEACCQPFHLGKKLPESAEELLRSRYSAYALVIPEYIVDTNHPEAPENQGVDVLKATRQAARMQQFEGLDILRHEPGAQVDRCEISHRVRYSMAVDDPRLVLQGGRRKYLRSERSVFVRENNSWLYLDSTALEDQELAPGSSRNKAAADSNPSTQ